MSPADRARAASAERASVERAEPPHVHKWSPWSPRFVRGPYTRRYCDCGAYQARRVAAIADALSEVTA